MPNESNPPAGSSGSTTPPAERRWSRPLIPIVGAATLIAAAVAATAVSLRVGTRILCST